MTNLKRSLLLFFVLMAIIACSSKPSIPDWVNSGKNPEKFKPLLYMTGIGQGPDLASAKDNARAEIAKQFSIKIEQEFKVFESYEGVQSESGSSWIMKTDVNDLTRTFVSETVSGIEVPEVFDDKDNNRFYAFAVLRRSPAMMRLTDKITEIDDKISANVKLSEEASDVLQKIRPLVKSYELMKERIIANRQLSIVNYAGVGIEPDVTPAKLDSMLSKALHNLSVSVEITGDASGKIRNAIVESLNNGKISVNPEGKDAQILVKGEAFGNETNKNNKTGYTFVKISANIALVNTQDGRTFGQIEHTMRDGALDLDDAISKTMTKLTKEIVKKFNSTLYSYLSM